MCFSGLNGTDNHDGLNGDLTGQVDTNTRNKLQKIMNEHENDPQFQYYNSDAESEGSHNSQEFYGNGDIGVVSPTGPGWNKDIGNKNFGISGKTAAQSNLQKHKSLSTPLFDLTKLDTIEADVDVDENDTYALHNEAYDSDNDEDEPGKPILIHVDVKQQCCLQSLSSPNPRGVGTLGMRGGGGGGRDQVFICEYVELRTLGTGGVGWWGVETRHSFVKTTVQVVSCYTQPTSTAIKTVFSRNCHKHF